MNDLLELFFSNTSPFLTLTFTKKHVPMEANLLAKAETDIKASPEQVWTALTNPDIVKKYMFGTTLKTDWQPGSDIFWEGEWQGKSYQDKGKVLEIVPFKLLKYTHYSPTSGKEDKIQNYHTVSVHLAPNSRGTSVILTQDNNPDEAGKAHSEKNWQMMLDELKKLLEDHLNQPPMRT